MASAQEMIVHSLHAAQLMLHRFLDELKPEEFLHQPCPGGNCAAWIVGHLVCSAHRQLKSLGAADVPELPAGFAERFATTKAAASTPGDYGDPKELLRLFDAVHQRLSAQVRQMTDAALAGPPPFATPLFANTGEALNFMGLHIAMHMGQVSVIRRSLGYPPVA
jgi:uncharacterized damage-inducible protein DinB